jgi:hypothetical protein
LHFSFSLSAFSTVAPKELLARAIPNDALPVCTAFSFYFFLTLRDISRLPMGEIEARAPVRTYRKRFGNFSEMYALSHIVTLLNA